MSFTSQIADLVIKINYLQFTVATNQVDPDSLMEVITLIESYDSQLRSLQRKQTQENIQRDITIGRWTKLCRGLQRNLLHQTCNLSRHSNA